MVVLQVCSHIIYVVALGQLQHLGRFNQISIEYNIYLGGISTLIYLPMYAHDLGT